MLVTIQVTCVGIVRERGKWSVTFANTTEVRVGGGTGLEDERGLVILTDDEEPPFVPGRKYTLTLAR